jgi:hypothetical protein
VLGHRPPMGLEGFVQLVAGCLDPGVDADLAHVRGVGRVLFSAASVDSCWRWIPVQARISTGMGDTGSAAAQPYQAFAADRNGLEVGHLSRGRDTCDRRVVALAPGEWLDRDQVLSQHGGICITAGRLNVDRADGQPHRFGAGDIPTLARLPIRSVHNDGTTPRRLLAIPRLLMAARTP